MLEPPFTITTTRRRFAVGRDGNVTAYCESWANAEMVRDALNLAALLLPSERS